MLEEPQWVSLHMFDHGMTRPILPTLIPLFEAWKESGLASRAFYLHHWEGGPHVRVRVLPSDPATHSILQVLVTQALHDIMSASTSHIQLDVKQYRQQIQALQVLEDNDAMYDIQPDGHVLRILYRTEWERYGGEKFRTNIIDLFDESSRVAGTTFLKQQTVVQRWHLGLVTSILVLKAVLRVSPKEPLDQLQYMADFWRGGLQSRQEEFIPWITSRFKTHSTRLTAYLYGSYAPILSSSEMLLIDSMINHFCAVASLDSEQKASQAVLGLLHLHHNRLGLSYWHETQLWNLLHLTAQQAIGGINEDK